MKNKKIIIIAAIAFIIVSSIGVFLLLKKESHTDVVKKYEVVEDSTGYQLNILEDIEPPKFKSQIIEKEKLKSIKKDMSMQYILNIIKDYDKTFNENDYTFSYNGASLNRNFVLTHNIGGIIETSKGYNVLCKDGKVNNIIILGTNKENIDNIKNVDTNKLLELVSNFKGETKAKKIYEAGEGLFKTDKVLNDDGTIILGNLKYATKKIKEKYYYDYDTEKLIYYAVLLDDLESEESDYHIEVNLN